MSKGNINFVQRIMTTQKTVASLRLHNISCTEYLPFWQRAAFQASIEAVADLDAGPNAVARPRARPCRWLSGTPCVAPSVAPVTTDRTQLRGLG
jgi:hypothetical protein